MGILKPNIFIVLTEKDTFEKANYCSWIQENGLCPNSGVLLKNKMRNGMTMSVVTDSKKDREPEMRIN